MKKDLGYYRSLPYSLTVERFTDEEDGETYFRASFKELPHVKGVHRERLMAVQLAKELFDSYIQAQLEWEEDIPEPEARRFRKRGGLFKFEASLESRSGSTAESDFESPTDPHGSKTSADKAAAPA